MTHTPESDDDNGGIETGPEVNMADPAAAEELRETRKAVEAAHDEVRELREEIAELKETVAAEEPAQADDAEAAADAEAAEPDAIELDREP